MIRELTFTSDQPGGNWFFEKYYYSGGNSRYWTFQLALNLLSQITSTPTIIETGCQRMADDLGAGMSTSIFGEFVTRYGGKLITVDLISRHLDICKECTREWSGHIAYVASDSLEFLRSYRGDLHLLYLDSVDYPVGPAAADLEMRRISQEHSLNEFLAIESHLSDSCILLLDDNMLPGGGKPKLLKEYLLNKRWLCLFDFQQSLWVPGL